MSNINNLAVEILLPYVFPIWKRFEVMRHTLIDKYKLRGEVIQIFKNAIFEDKPIVIVAVIDTFLFWYAF